MANKRLQLDVFHIRGILSELQNRIETQVKQKGDGSFISPHEILGVLLEEHTELIEAIQKNDPNRTIDELYDNAVVCIWGILSMIEHDRYEVMDEPE